MPKPFRSGKLGPIEIRLLCISLSLFPLSSSWKDWKTCSDDATNRCFCFFLSGDTVLLTSRIAN